jgi:hypothetical protein
MKRFGFTGPAPRRPTRRSPPASRPCLEVLEGRTVPAFLTAVTHDAGLYPQAIAVGHLNADAALDLVVANYGDSTVSVLLGNGDGTFRAAQDYSTGGGPLSVAVGDLDGDGTDDVATANGGDVSVLLNNGDGTLGPAASIDLGSGPSSVAVGDFNGDGKLDLGVTSNVYYPGYSVWYSSYGYYGYYSGYYWHPGHYEGRANVLLGNGDGTFSGPYTSGLGYGYHTSAFAADLNGDGNDDFAAVNSDSGTVTVSLGADAGDPLGGARGYNTGWYPRAVTAGDFTGDGVLDLATAGQTVDILPGHGDGTFQGVVRQYIDPAALAAADFNGDGNLDVVTANYGSTVSVQLGNGDGTLKPPIDVATGADGAVSVAVGDFNGDGRIDVAVANSGSGSVSVLLNDGTLPAAVAPSITVDDVTVTEGNTGTTAVTFTVRLSAAYGKPVTVDYATADGTATVAGGDYRATSGTLTFAPGVTSMTVTVLVNGDRAVESTESFTLLLSNPTNAFVTDATGVGTVTDDEPRITINNVSKKEGNGKTTVFTFTVKLSQAYDEPVTVNYATADGTAKTSDNDYVAKSGTVTFAPGETSKTITVVVKGDKKKESSESFFVNLSGASGNALILDAQALGTIFDDDNR